MRGSCCSQGSSGGERVVLRGQVLCEPEVGKAVANVALQVLHLLRGRGGFQVARAVVAAALFKWPFGQPAAALDLLGPGPGPQGKQQHQPQPDPGGTRQVFA
ncbi:MAG: hypothetical protein IPJ36_19365 [Simplicispira sp.]|nr:hypothetical protein [Simplicispira sp.]